MAASVSTVVFIGFVVNNMFPFRDTFHSLVDNISHYRYWIAVKYATYLAVIID